MNKFDVQQHIEELPGFVAWAEMKQLPRLLDPSHLHPQDIESTFIVDYHRNDKLTTIRGKLLGFDANYILMDEARCLYSIPTKDILCLEMVGP